MPNTFQESFLYQNRYRLIAILVFIILGLCWNSWTKSGDEKENQTEQSVQDTKETPEIPEMPEDYVEFAAALIGKMSPSLDEIKRDYSFAIVNPFEAQQKAILELEKLKISSSLLEEQRQNVIKDIHNVFESLEQLNQEPTIQNANRFPILLQKADSYPGILAHIGKDYSKQPEDNNGRIIVDFDTLPSPNATEEYDVIAIANTGTPIQNAIFCITLTNKNNESVCTYTFARQIENQWLYSLCRQGISFGDNRTVLSHTVKDVSSIKVEMFSHDFSTIVDYSYDAEERGKDQKAAYQTANLALGWQKRSPGFFSDYQREAYVRLSNVDLPPCDVKFDYYNGEKHHSIVWNMKNGWQQGQKTFTAGNEELTFEPEKIEITILFPNSNFMIIKSFDID